MYMKISVWVRAAACQVGLNKKTVTGPQNTDVVVRKYDNKTFTIDN